MNILSSSGKWGASRAQPEDPGYQTILTNTVMDSRVKPENDEHG